MPGNSPAHVDAWANDATPLGVWWSALGGAFPSEPCQTRRSGCDLLGRTAWGKSAPQRGLAEGEGSGAAHGDGRRRGGRAIGEGASGSDQTRMRQTARSYPTRCCLRIAGRTAHNSIAMRWTTLEYKRSRREHPLSALSCVLQRSREREPRCMPPLQRLLYQRPQSSASVNRANLERMDDIRA